MKNLITIITLFLAFSINANAQEKDQYKIQVDGLGCPFCAYGLEKKFKEFKGIKDVKIDMETGVFTFSYPDDKPLSLEQVENQVDKAGYTSISAEILRSNGKKESSSHDKNESEESISYSSSDKFSVKGNCDMCKAKIEKTVNNLNGVSNAIWSVDTKLLSFNYDENITNKKAIAEKVAEVGYDNEFATSKDEIYENLPVCCLYKRDK